MGHDATVIFITDVELVLAHGPIRRVCGVCVQSNGRNNGSTASSLHWYQDRFTGQPDATWVLSMPVLAYRLLMLFWALWLAASIVRWTKWAWECFSLGGYWRKREPVVQQAEDAQAHHPADNTPAA